MVADNWLTILVAAPLIMLTKAAIIYLIFRGFKRSHNEAIRVASLLPQVGEFAFVIFSTAVAAFVVSTNLASIITAIVTVTMALTPLFAKLGDRLILQAKEDEIEEDFEGANGSVLVIGFGRFGQIVSQSLLAEGIPTTVIDHSAERIRSAAKFGFRVYYGEGRRIDVLRAAGIERARIVAVCADTAERTSEIIDLIRNHYPDIKIYVRAYDRIHALELTSKEIDFQVREIFESALLMGRALLDGMDVPPERVDYVIEDVRKRDLGRLQLQQVKGVFAGKDKLYGNKVEPEPLNEPTTQAKMLSEETEKIANEDS